jgi:biotin carboxylase
VNETAVNSPGKTRRVLLLDEIDDGLALAVSRCLQLAGGYEVHCLTGTADAVLRRSRHCRVRHVEWDTSSGMLTAVTAYVERESIDVVVPIQEVMTVMAGGVAEQLERFAQLAPGPGPRLCSEVDNKWSFHQMVSDAGLAVPRAVLASTERASLARELNDWDTPLLLKPTLGSGGRGIRSFARPDDLLKALDDTAPATLDMLLIEEFVPGQNVSCNLLCVDGEIIASTVHRSVLRQAAEFTSAGLGLQFVRDDSVVGVATRFAEASRWTGVVNLNIRIDSRTGEPVFIEANPRYWQTVLASLAMGINFPDVHCRLAFGESPTVPASRTGFYLDSHSLLTSPRNVVALVTREPGFLRYIDWRIMRADPRLDIEIAYRTVKRGIARVVARARQLISSPMGTLGRSS